MAAPRLATRPTGSRAGEGVPPRPHVSDGELVAAFQNGDQRAFDALYERYRTRIVVFYRQRTRTPDAAEDYAHDVFVSALAHLDSFDRSRPMWPWLKTIARNRLIDHYRASNHWVDVPDDALPDVDRDFDEHTASMAEQQVLTQAIDRLPPRERAALTLKYRDELDTGELQESFGIGRSAVYKLLQRARDQLRDAYEDLTDSKLAGLLPTPLVGRLHRVVERVRARAAGLEASLLAAPNSLEAFASAATAVAIGVGLVTVAAHDPPDVPIDQGAAIASTSHVASSDFVAEDATASTSFERVEVSERPIETVDEPRRTTPSRRSVTAEVSSPETGPDAPARVDATVEGGNDEGETIEVFDEIEGDVEMDNPTDESEMIDHDMEMTIYCEPTTAGRVICAAYHAADRELPDDLP